MLDKMVDVAKLRNLIGHEVHFDGQRCQIIEVLEDGPAVILQNQDHDTTIQPDQHGEAHRKVPATFTIPVLCQEGEGLNPEFSAMQLHTLL